MVERVEDNFQAYGAFTLPWFQSSTIQLVQKHHSLQNYYFIQKKPRLGNRVVSGTRKVNLLGVFCVRMLSQVFITSQNLWHIAQCVLCQVRCHCMFSGTGIRYSDIFCVPCIRQWIQRHILAYFVVDTVTYFGGNHGSRV